MKVLGKCSAIVSATVLLLGLGAVPAMSSEPASGITVTTVLHVTGYDEEVAAQHGFRIDVVDGKATSVPVTEEARRLASTFGSANKNEFAPTNTVRGNCGNASLSATKRGNEVRIATSYVAVAVAPTVGHVWFVTLIDSGYRGLEDFSGLNASRSWATSRESFLTVTGGGIASASGLITRLDGIICGSFNPLTPSDGALELRHDVCP